VCTGTRGRPPQQSQGLAADQGDDANDLRQCLRQRGFRPQLLTCVWHTSKPRGRPMPTDVPRLQGERTGTWCQRQNRRVVVRWARLAACCNAYLTLAMTPM